MVIGDEADLMLHLRTLMRVDVDVVIDVDRRRESLVAPQHLALLDHWRVAHPDQFWS